MVWVFLYLSLPLRCRFALATLFVSFITLSILDYFVDLPLSVSLSGSPFDDGIMLHRLLYLMKQVDVPANVIDNGDGTLACVFVCVCVFVCRFIVQ